MKVYLKVYFDKNLMFWYNIGVFLGGICMAKCSDERIDIADLKMLRDILSSDSKKLEIDIINTLGNIYSLSDEIIYYQNIIKKDRRFWINTFLNFIKSLGFSCVSYVFIIDQLEKNPEMTYSVLCCLSSSLVGFKLFQDDNRENNYVSGKVYEKSREEYLNLTDRLQKYVEDYFNTIQLYLGSNNGSIKEEVNKIFDNNEKYINDNIDSGRFLEDFSCERVFKIAGSYLDDNYFEKFIKVCDSEQKQRKR